MCISPVLCNVYLHRLDREWAKRGTGVLIRYADDLLVMCRTKQDAQDALVALSAILAELGLGLKQAKTRIVLCESEARDSIVSASITATCAATLRGHNISRSWSAGLHARPCSTSANAFGRSPRRERLLLPVEDIIQDLNRFLGGWAGYFRYGNSAQFFDKITLHAVNRLSIFVANRRQRDRRFGWWVVARQSPDRLGLIDLNGIVVPPRAHQPRLRAR